MASDTGGRRVLSRQLHSSIFHQANTMGFSYFRNVLHKIPHPLFPPPLTQRERWHSFPKLHCKFLEGGEGMCVYSPIPRVRDTPCFSATPWYTPSPSLVVGPPQQQRLQPQPRSCLIAPSQPEPTTGIAQTGRGNTQNRHSNSRKPAAPTEIFNSLLNLTGKW